MRMKGKKVLRGNNWGLSLPGKCLQIGRGTIVLLLFEFLYSLRQFSAISVLKCNYPAIQPSSHPADKKSGKAYFPSPKSHSWWTRWQLENQAFWSRA